VVWFGEPLPAAAWEEAETAARSAGVMLVVGTSAAVYPAAGLAPLAKGAGARLIEINVDETPLSQWADCSLRGKAAELLPRLIE
jgi:NAD-dependent deacetylase